jgi:hypothetical protein
LPDLETSFWGEYGDDGLYVIAIDSNALDVSDIAGLIEYVDYLQPTFPVATEADGEGTYDEVTAIYEGSNPFPTNIIVDKYGVIQYVAREYDPFTMEALVVELLAQP